MDFFDKMLKEARDEKFETIKEIGKDFYTCNHSDGGDKCIACTHPNICIFNDKRIELDEKEAICNMKIKEFKKDIEDSKKSLKYYKNELRKIKKEYRGINNDNM